MINNQESKEKKEFITPVGEVHHRGACYRFGIKIDDRRRHTYVIGKTGVGKSTLLENMAISDVESGLGVGVIDPHGELAETLLDYIPEDRLEDVVYFDPGDTEFPIGFNPLEKVSGEHRHLIASSMMGVFKKIWPDVWSSRMEYILNNALLALLEYPGATFIGILRMFAEKDYLKKVVSGLEDPVVRSYWENEYANYSERYRVEAIGAIQNKIGQFVTNPLIRNILGQSYSSIDIRKIMDEGKILIVNLSKGKIGEDNMALLGGMIIAKLQLAAMSRADSITKDYKDFLLNVDEFQNFATDSFAGILSEARKYKLSLTLAHQYISQLNFDGNTKVRDAVMGNVGTFLCFRVGADDAEFLEKEFMPDYDANDLVNLPKFNVLARMIIDGINSPPFPAVTLPPREKPENSYKDLIIEYSRKKYARPRTAVERKIKEEWGSKDVVLNKIDNSGSITLESLKNEKNNVDLRSSQKNREEPEVDPQQKEERPKRDEGSSTSTNEKNKPLKSDKEHSNKFVKKSPENDDIDKKPKDDVDIDNLRNLLRSALDKEKDISQEDDKKDISDGEVNIDNKIGNNS